MLMRFKVNPEPRQSGALPPGAGEKGMHASFRIGGTTLLASDCYCQGKPSFQGFSLSHTVPTPAAAKRAFQGLSDGGQVKSPLGKAFFSPLFWHGHPA